MIQKIKIETEIETDGDYCNRHCVYYNEWDEECRLFACEIQDFERCDLCRGATNE